ncbi:MAG: hypothetical protein WC951_03805 [Bacteroidales bacterium]
MPHPNTIIHIGFPKTATTWFQYNFFPYVSNAFFLPRAEILRPLVLSQNPLLFSGEEVKKVINKQFTQNQKELFILSDEGFLARNFFQIKDFAYRIKSLVENPQIVIFIRNQKTMLSSMYSQYLKSNGGTYNLKYYLFGHPRVTKWTNATSFDNMSLLKYDVIIQFYKELFGKSNIHIFLYEDFIKDPKKFCEKFSKKFNFQIDLNKLSYGKKNEGIRSGLIFLQRFLNSFTAGPKYEKHYIWHIPYMLSISFRTIKILNRFKIFGNSIKIHNHLSKKDYNTVLDYYRETNRNLIIKHNIKGIEEHKYPI